MVTEHALTAENTIVADTARIAEKLEGPFSKLEVAGSTEVMDESLFEVRNKDGKTVFAVYNEGVRIYVDDGEKGVKGGFG